MVLITSALSTTVCREPAKVISTRSTVLCPLGGNHRRNNTCERATELHDKMKSAGVPGNIDNLCWTLWRSLGHPLLMRITPCVPAAPNKSDSPRFQLYAVDGRSGPYHTVEKPPIPLAV